MCVAAKNPVSLASGQLQVLTSVGKHYVWSGVTRIISSPNQLQDALACVNGWPEIFLVFTNVSRVPVD